MQLFCRLFKRTLYGSARPNLATGIVAKAEGLRDDPSSFQTTARIRPGNSGGPVFDLAGRLLGVISATLLHDGHVPAELDETVPVSVAVKSDRILHLMDEPAPIQQAQAATFTPEEIYRRMLGSIVLVAAYP